MSTKQKEADSITKEATPKQVFWMPAHTGTIQHILAIVRLRGGSRRRGLVIRVQTEGNRIMYLCGFCSRNPEKTTERPLLHTKKRGDFTHTCPICGCDFVVQKGVSFQQEIIESEDLLVTQV